MSTTTTSAFGPCPAWCPEPHEQAIDEGCTPEEARVHMGEDVGQILADIVNPPTGRLDRAGGGGWTVMLRADPGEDTTWTGFPTVQLEIRERDSGGPHRVYTSLQLTSGEARILARQLTHFADEVDLPR